MMRRVADMFVVRPIAYILRQVGFRDDVMRRLDTWAIDDSARFYLENMPRALRFKTRYPLFDYALSQCGIDGLVLEFGSYKGKSLRYLGPRIEGPLHGFDSFRGLREEWAGSSRKGTFDAGGKLPKVPSNVRLHEGWFHETLPDFLADHPEPVRFLHLDADTYESTAYVLTMLQDRIVPGTVIQFDEYFGYSGWRLNEYLALEEFIARTGAAVRYLGFGWLSVAVIVESIGSQVGHMRGPDTAGPGPIRSTQPKSTESGAAKLLS